MRHPVVLACLTLGIILRTIQFAAQSSLWLDELAVAHTTIVRDLGRLITEPLAYRQVAPAGFLAFQKIAIGIAGASESGFRLLPWLASIAALFVFWAIAERLVTRTAAWTTMVLLAASPALTWFGSQAKQYSTDVLGVLLLVWAGSELLSSRPRVTRAVLAGSFALLMSMPAVLTGSAIGIVLLVAAARRKIPGRTFVVAGICWTFAALVTAALAQLAVSADTREYMLMFWARGFPPAPTSLQALAWTPRVLHDSLGFALFFRLEQDVWIVRTVVLTLALLIVPGGWWLARRSPYYAAMVIAPIATGLLAAAVRLLPIDGRVSLWLVGPLLLLAGAGLSAMSEWLTPQFRAIPVAAASLFSAVAISGVVILDPPPYHSQHLRPVLEKAAAHMEPGDAIYVYYGARLSMRFYGPRVGITRWTEGNCHRRRTAEYFRELDEFRGRPRVWVIWTHAIPRFGEPEAIRSYLSTIGNERLRIDAEGGVGDVGAGQALLYDLSDPARLASTAADRHPIPPPEFPNAGPNVPCGGPANDPSVVR